MLRFPKASIGLYLAGMALAISLPILAFVALLLVQLERNEQDALERRTSRDVQTVAMGVGRQLQDMSSSLRLLASAPELENGDLRAFHDRTAAALKDGAMYVLVVQEDGQQLVNTRVPFDTPLGKTSDMTTLQTSLRTGNVVASDVFFGQTSQRWVINVIKPLPKGLNSKAAALIMTQNVDELGKYVTAEGLAPAWSSALIDEGGHVITSSDTVSNPPGKVFSTDLLPRMTDFAGVLDEGQTAPGNVLGYATLPGWSWKAVIWGPAASARVSVLATWRLLIVGGTVLLGIAVLAAYLVGAQLRKPIEAIADMAERMGAGEIVSPIDTKILEANQVAVALSNASFDRSQAEDQIHLILRELAHRTKNMLTLIQAMMRQTGKKSGTVADFQHAMSLRLEGLGRSIDLLTSVEWSGVAMRRLVESQTTNFVDTPGRIDIRGEDFGMKPEAVQNLGLALHELATNAVKYGALSDPRGKVLIEWDEVAPEGGDPKIRVRWTETGGPPPKAQRRAGFGTTIIERHTAAAFNGKVDLAFDTQGMRWELVAPREALMRTPRGA